MSNLNERNKKRRKVYKKTPGNKTVQEFKAKKPGKAKCGNCGSELHGVPRKSPNKMKNSSKTSKRPERPYGGNLCSKCMREKFRVEASIE